MPRGLRLCLNASSFAGKPRVYKQFSLSRKGIARSSQHQIRPHSNSSSASSNAAESDMGSSTKEYERRWEGFWSKGLKIGDKWDVGCASLALEELLEAERKADAAGGETIIGNLKGKRVLVPGCGRGYDVVSFVEKGAEKAVGLELAPSAVAAAEEHVAILGEAKNAAAICEGNFFTWESDEEPFDVGYDYTFFCAIHPDQRSEWAKHWKRYLKPNGVLITLIFPVEEDLSRQGPPWPVTPSMYEKALEHEGFRLLRMEPVPEDKSHHKRAGREILAVWKRP